MTDETEAVKKLIAQLQQKHTQEIDLISNNLYTIYESLRPANFIKDTIVDLAESHDLKSNLIETAIGIGASVLMKSLMDGNSNEPVKLTIASVVKFIVVDVLPKHSEQIKYSGKIILYGYLKNRKANQISKFNEMKQTKLSGQIV